MATEQNFLDYSGLEYYHQKNVALMDNKDAVISDKVDTLSADVAYISDETTDVGEIATVLTTQHIVDNLDSSLNTMALSAKQGKVLNERMDTFIALEEGSTTGDAELADIRIDAGGTTHASAGDAVRSQVNQLSSEIVEIKETIPYTNMLNVKDSEVGFSYDSRTGRGIEKASNANYTACNQIFTVKGGEMYTLNWLYGAIYLYDSDKTLVSYNYVDSIPYTVTVAQDGYMTVAGSTRRMNDIMLVRGDTLPSEYVEYGVLNITTEQGNRLEKQIDSLNGVKWCAFGDSLTDSATLSNMTNKKNYVDYVGTSLGLDVTNCGVGGSGYMKTENRFVNRVSTIPTDAEVLTVLGSFNDHEFIETNLGVFGDNGTDTIYGCMYSFFDTVFSRCPDIVVGVILPTKWGYLSPQKDSEASAKCDLYIKALTETAEYYNLPILDLYNGSNLRPWEDNFAERYYKDDDSDGNANTVHPLDEAHKKFIAPKVEAFIKSIYKRY